MPRKSNAKSVAQARAPVQVDGGEERRQPEAGRAQSSEPPKNQDGAAARVAGRGQVQKGLVDPDTVLRKKIDKSFLTDDDVAKIKLPQADQVYKIVDKLPIPQIDVNANPNTLTTVQFLYEMMAFADNDPQSLRPVVAKAFQGTTGKSWCSSTQYDLTKTTNLLTNWMWKRQDWIDTKGKLELGKPLSDNLVTHIHYFRLIAMYMGLEAESEETKQLFIDSVKCLPMDRARDADGKLRSLREIMQEALMNKHRFETWAKMEKQTR